MSIDGPLSPQVANTQMALALHSVAHLTTSGEFSGVLQECFADPVLLHIANSLTYMEIAEKRIRHFQTLNAEKAQRLRNAFVHLRWMLYPQVVERQYVHHVDELLQRVVDGESLEPATCAEVLTLLSYTSLKSPLTSEGAALMDQLFAAIWGDASPVREVPPCPELWPGASAELLKNVRMRASNASRKLDEGNDT